MATVPAMGMNRFVAAIERRVRRMRSQAPSPERAEASGSEETAIEDPAQIERRRRERARFTDDAAYFQFLIERAVETNSAAS